MGDFYSKQCNAERKRFDNVEPSEVVGNEHGGKCLVNHKAGGHEAHFVPFMSGELLRKFLDLAE